MTDDDHQETHAKAHGHAGTAEHNTLGKVCANEDTNATGYESAADVEENTSERANAAAARIVVHVGEKRRNPRSQKIYGSGAKG